MSLFIDDFTSTAQVIGFRLMGSTRFNLSGDRVDFALAQGEPTNARGWVASADRIGGQAKMLVVRYIRLQHTDRSSPRLRWAVCLPSMTIDLPQFYYYRVEST